MAKSIKKLIAFKLRRKGKSIKEIAKLISVSKSSVSIWCRDIQLTPKQKLNLQKKMIKAGHLGRLRGALTNKMKKEKRLHFYTELARKKVGKLTNRDLSIAGLGIYWGEGSKGKYSFANSDPLMVIFMSKWLQKYMRVKKDDLSPRVYINEIHREREKKVLRFWATLLDLPKQQFSKTVFIKARQKKTYANHDSHYGILTLRVAKSTNLSYYVLGMVDVLRNKSLLGSSVGKSTALIKRGS